LAPKIKPQPHRGGQIGLVALVAMLIATGCVAWTEKTSNGGLSFLPAWGQDRVETPQELPAEAETVSAPAASFIVRFDNEPVLSEIGKSFRRDQAAARKKFAAWLEDHPALQGLRLSRASYSGELILILPSDDPKGRSPEDVLKTLNAMENLAYAELDVMAKASGGAE
jgi:hypothetical protein